MLALEWIAEQKIAAAAERGDLQDLPGSGQPLDLYEDPLVPEEMKMVKRILGNAEVSLADVFASVRQCPNTLAAGQTVLSESTFESRRL